NVFHIPSCLPSLTTRWQAREPLPPEQNSFNLSSMNAALFDISTSQPSSTQSSQASWLHQSFRPSQSSELSDPFEILDFLKSALNPGQGSAPHMNNYVHPTRLRGGVRRNVPYEREEQARVDGRPYRKTLLIIDRKVRNRAYLIDLMSNFQVDLSARLFYRVDYTIAIP
ncbi:hypothetical protein D6C99_00241, partial [Aureobasidium pullulans]